MRLIFSLPYLPYASLPSTATAPSSPTVNNTPWPEAVNSPVMAILIFPALSDLTSDVLIISGPFRFTLPVNIAGLPGMSLPAGFADGLPVGMQIIGRPFGEETMLHIAYAYEQATEWHKKWAAV